MSYPDINKTLPILRQEWEQCTACALGQRRQETGGAFVFGEGVPGKLMIIGEGPGKEEEQHGRPFMGKGGEALRMALRNLGLENEVYLTNCVPCRACAQHYDGEGQPSFNRDGSAYIIDQAPTKVEVDTCRTRLEEEIYMVDPLMIIALGGGAAEALLKRSVSVTAENGTTHSMFVPGAGSVPRLTEKKKKWARKVRGEHVTPVDQNQVEYLCMVCLHPSFVLRSMKDQRHGNPADAFMQSLTLARDVYRKVEQEIPGVIQ